jgi:hypothetical protein
MRVVTTLAVLVTVLAATGCGSKKQAEPAWDGPPAPAPNGTVEVGGFGDYAGSVDAAWRRSAAMAAGEFLRLDRRTASRVTIDAKASTGEGSGPQTVVVTLDGLPDDSVHSERWTLVFHESDGAFTLASATREQRCQPGRGHVAYAPGPCA